MVNTVEHQMTHFPKLPHCPHCQRAKMQQAPGRRRNCDTKMSPVPKKFGDQITADHIVASSEYNMGMTGDQVAVVIKDRATDYIAGIPLKSKSAEDARAALDDFQGPSSPVRVCYTDNSPELIAAVRELKWLKGKSTPGLPKTNAVAERTVRRICEGVRTLLLGAGLPACFWPWAMNYYCHAHNIADRDGSSPWFERHGAHFTGKKIPFGAFVDYLPPPGEVKTSLKMGPRGVPAIFLGWRFNPGNTFHGEYIVARLEDFVGQDLGYECRFSVDERVTRTIYWDGDLEFPIRSEYERANRTLRGLRELRWDPFSEDVPAHRGVRPPTPTHPGYHAEGEEQEAGSGGSSSSTSPPPRVAPGGGGRKEEHRHLHLHPNRLRRPGGSQRVTATPPSSHYGRRIVDRSSASTRARR